MRWCGGFPRLGAGRWIRTPELRTCRRRVFELELTGPETGERKMGNVKRGQTGGGRGALQVTSGGAQARKRGALSDDDHITLIDTSLITHLCNHGVNVYEM